MGSISDGRSFRIVVAIAVASMSLAAFSAYHRTPWSDEGWFSSASVNLVGKMAFRRDGENHPAIAQIPTGLRSRRLQDLLDRKEVTTYSPAISCGASANLRGGGTWLKAFAREGPNVVGRLARRLNQIGHR